MNSAKITLSLQGVGMSLLEKFGWGASILGGLSVVYSIASKIGEWVVVMNEIVFLKLILASIFIFGISVVFIERIKQRNRIRIENTAAGKKELQKALEDADSANQLANQLANRLDAADKERREMLTANNNYHNKVDSIGMKLDDLTGTFETHKKVHKADIESGLAKFKEISERIIC